MSEPRRRGRGKARLAARRDAAPSTRGGGGWLRLVWITLALAAGAALLVLLLESWSTEATRVQDARLARRGAVLVLLTVSVFAFYAHRWRSGLRPLAVWGLILTPLVIGYAFRAEFVELGERAWAVLAPDSGVAAGPDAVAVEAAEDGRYYVAAEVDGTRVRFVVDAGATMVVLTRADARRVGFDPDRLNYAQGFETEDGPARGAPVRLREVRIGPLVLRDVRATVHPNADGSSVLGRTALNRLASVALHDGVLTLHGPVR